MSKIPLDYSTSVIYKISHIDPSIDGCYVGSTTNFNDRLRNRRNSSLRPTKSRLYSHIQKHGGWSNFSMVIIEKFPCKSKNELHEREKIYVDQLATLNRNSPIGIRKKPYIYNSRYREYRKQWRDSHREYIRDYNSNYTRKN